MEHPRPPNDPRAGNAQARLEYYELLGRFTLAFAIITATLVAATELARLFRDGSLRL